MQQVLVYAVKSLDVFRNVARYAVGLFSEISVSRLLYDENNSLEHCIK